MPPPKSLFVKNPKTWPCNSLLPEGVITLIMPPSARPNSAFRDHHAELAALGAEVYGLSTQTTEFQQEMVARLHLPFPVLSDSALTFAQALDLPRFQWDNKSLIKRLTLVLREGRIEHVFYPVFPPDENAETVIAWLTAQQI